MLGKVTVVTEPAANRHTRVMFVRCVLDSWPGLDVGVAQRVVGEQWRERGHDCAVDVVPMPLPGGARVLADATRIPVSDVVTGFERRSGMWLAPALGQGQGHFQDGAEQAWDSAALGKALAALAAGESGDGDFAAAGTLRIVITVGDTPPHTDPTDVWLGDLAGLKSALESLEILVLVTSDRPLLGFKGMSAAMRDGNESDPFIAQLSQESEKRWSAIAAEADAVSARKTLLGNSRLSDEPGSGAARGLAYCLAALGARVVPFSKALEELLTSGQATPEPRHEPDLWVAVTSHLTPRSLDTAVAAAVSGIAARSGIPAVVLTGAAEVGKRDQLAAGLAAVHEAQGDAVGLADGVRRLAQTWGR